MHSISILYILFFCIQYTSKEEKFKFSYMHLHYFTAEKLGLANNFFFKIRPEVNVKTHPNLTDIYKNTSMYEVVKF